MNFLAHSFFALSRDDVIVGQFLGDFVRGGDLDRFPEAMRRGIVLHRQIDSYTDAHPVNLRARQLFEAPYRRFAGIMTDVVYDHYLARHWETYASEPLNRHVAQVYHALETHFELLPPNLQRFARVVIDDDILTSYLEFEAVELALKRISRRSPRFQLLADAGPVLQARDQPLSDCFAGFFPDLIEKFGQSGTI